MTKISQATVVAHLHTDLFPIYRPGQDTGDKYAVALSEQLTESITGTASLDATDFGKLFVCSGTTSDYTVTLPTAASNTGKSIAFKGSSALTKLITIDGFSTETIDGASNIVLWAGEVLVVMSDGTNWIIVSWKKNPMVASCQATTQSVANGSAVIADLSSSLIDNTGALVDLANNRILIKRNGLYRMSTRFSPASSANAANNIQQYFYIDGVLLSANSLSVSLAANITEYYLNETRPVALNSGQYVDLRLYHDTTGGAARNFVSYLTVEEIV